MITKFRIYEKEANVFRDVLAIDFEEGKVWTEPLTITDGREKVFSFFEDVTIMKSIGIRDKHDVDIFEGDIVKGKRVEDRNESFSGEVVWDPQSMSYYVINKSMSRTVHISVLRDFEIIGDVYRK